MKLNRDIQYPSSTHQDQWEKLKQFTDARIALGRAGCSIPTRALLEFQLSHAQAKDAVYQDMNVSYLSEQLTQNSCKVFMSKVMHLIKKFILNVQI